MTSMYWDVTQLGLKTMFLIVEYHFWTISYLSAISFKNRKIKKINLIDFDIQNSRQNLFLYIINEQSIREIRYFNKKLCAIWDFHENYPLLLPNNKVHYGCHVSFFEYSPFNLKFNDALYLKCFFGLWVDYG